MKFDEVIVFDIESEYGHFRKFNTTTSPLTYSIPTRPAIAGIVGAMLGIERELSANRFPTGVTPVADLFSKENAAFAIQVLHPVQKVNIAFNLIDTKTSGFGKIKQRTQIEFELLKKPYFRVFVGLKNKQLLKELIERVRQKKLHFTPYLGISQFTITVRYVDVAYAKQTDNDASTQVITAVNLNLTNQDDPVQFDYTGNFKYTSDTMPVVMQKDRIVTEYAEVITEVNGQPINIKSSHITQVENHGNILFL